MKKYRLKKEARQFFDPDLSSKVKPMSFWGGRDMNTNALEEVEEPYVIYGRIDDKDPDVTHLNSWSEKNGRRYEFSIFVPGSGFGDIADRNLVLKVVDAANDVLNEHYK